MDRRTFLAALAAVTTTGMSSTTIQAAEARPLIAYFSCTGNTKAVAEQIAEATGGDIFEIIPTNPYSAEDLNYNNKKCRANIEMHDPAARPAIAKTIPNFSDYSVIYIGYPNWWGTMPRIINTFLESYDFGCKIIRPFCTSGGSGVEKSVADIKKVVPTATVKKGLLVPGSSARNSSEKITRWINQN